MFFPFLFEQMKFHFFPLINYENSVIFSSILVNRSCFFWWLVDLLNLIKDDARYWNCSYTSKSYRILFWWHMHTHFLSFARQIITFETCSWLVMRAIENLSTKILWTFETLCKNHCQYGVGMMKWNNLCNNVWNTRFSLHVKQCNSY